MKSLEKLIFKRILPKLIPILFPFTNSDSVPTTQQASNASDDDISLAWDNKKYCSGVFLDIAQAFHKV